MPIYEKLFAIMKALPSIDKTGIHDEGDSGPEYSYLEANELKKRFRRELIKKRVLCLPEHVDNTSHITTTSTGSRMFHSVQKMTYKFIDVDTGESLTCQAVGHGQDVMATDAPKAAIQALKYFVANAFFIETKDVEDGDSGIDAKRLREESAGLKYEATVKEMREDNGGSHLILMVEFEGKIRPAFVAREREHIYLKLGKKIDKPVKFRATISPEQNFHITKLCR